MLTVRRWWGESVALLGGLLYAVDPWSKHYVALVLSETLAGTVALALLYVFTRAWERPTFGSLARRRRAWPERFRSCARCSCSLPLLLVLAAVVRSGTTRERLTRAAATAAAVCRAARAVARVDAQRRRAGRRCRSGARATTSCSPRAARATERPPATSRRIRRSSRGWTASGAGPARATSSRAIRPRTRATSRRADEQAARRRARAVSRAPSRRAARRAVGRRLPNVVPLERARGLVPAGRRGARRARGARLRCCIVLALLGAVTRGRARRSRTRRGRLPRGLHARAGDAPRRGALRDAAARRLPRARRARAHRSGAARRPAQPASRSAQIQNGTVAGLPTDVMYDCATASTTPAHDHADARGDLALGPRTRGSARHDADEHARAASKRSSPASPSWSSVPRYEFSARSREERVVAVDEHPLLRAEPVAERAAARPPDRIAPARRRPAPLGRRERPRPGGSSWVREADLVLEREDVRARRSGAERRRRRRKMPVRDTGFDAAFGGSSIGRRIRSEERDGWRPRRRRAPPGQAAPRATSASPREGRRRSRRASPTRRASRRGAARTAPAAMLLPSRARLELRAAPATSGRTSANSIASVFGFPPIPL